VTLKHFAATGFLAAACFFGGCVFLLDDPNTPVNPSVPPDTPDIDTTPVVIKPSRDSGLAGDWRTVYVNDDGSGIEITSLALSGGVTYGGFLKAGSFWIEGWDNIGTWRTSNDTLYEELRAGGTDTLLYSISGNRVTISFCDRGICGQETVVAEKTDIAAVRSGLNAVYTQNPALFASAVYNDLMWYLEIDDEFDEIIDFDMMYFWYGERYFGDDTYYDQVWYTAGSDLFLIGMDRAGEVQKNVKLWYGIAGDGFDARLSIRPVLEDGGLGLEDVWLPAECWDCDLYWLPYKSRQNGKPAKKNKKAFAPARPHKAAVKQS